MKPDFCMNTWKVFQKNYVKYVGKEFANRCYGGY